MSSAVQAEPHAIFAHGRSGRICLADDDSTSRLMLRMVLERWGYQVEECGDGNEAFAQLSREDGPDLALLDWMMPGMDGVELSRRLRHEFPKRNVYVILVTSRTEDADVQAALRSGADDFVSKPYSPVILQARIEVGFRTLEMQRTIRDFANRMESLAESRAAQLLHSDRLASLGILSASVAHEINNPASFIAVNLQTFQDLWPSVEACLAGHGTGLHQARAEALVKEMPGMLSEMQDGLERIRHITADLRSFSRTGQSICRPQDVVECLRKALRMCSIRIKGKVELELDLPDLPVPVVVDEGRLEQVFVNLVMNAADAMEDLPLQRLGIELAWRGESIEITFRDCGHGVPEDRRDSLFQPFHTTKPTGKGTGLGLYISRGIVEGFGGTLRYEPVPEGGTAFVVQLPLARQETP